METLYGVTGIQIKTRDACCSEVINCQNSSICSNVLISKYIRYRNPSMSRKIREEIKYSPKEYVELCDAKRIAEKEIIR